MMHESDERTLVKFYSLSCNHCHALAPTWKKLAKEFNGIVRIGALNCEDAWSVCNDIRIDSYPTLALFGAGESIQIFQQPTRTLENMANFALEGVQLPEKLNAEAMAKLVESSSNTVVVVCHEGSGEKKEKEKEKEKETETEKETAVSRSSSSKVGAESVCDSQYGRRVLVQSIGSLVNVATIDCSAESATCEQYGFVKASAWFFEGSEAAPRSGKMFFPPKEKNAKKYAWGDTGITATVRALRARLAKRFQKPQDLDWKLWNKHVHETGRLRTGTAPGQDPETRWLVSFVSGTKCPECPAVLDLGRQMAFRAIPGVRTYRVRCDSNDRICKQQDVRNTPELRLYSALGYEVYHGALDATLGAGLVADWVKQGLKSNVTAITDKSYAENIHKGRAWMVLFCEPWSELCLQAERRFRQASQVKVEHKYNRYHEADADDTPPPPTPEEQPRFGTIDCGKYAKLCDVWNVVSYPSSIYFDAQSRSFVFQGDFQDSYSVVDHILDVHNPPIIELNPTSFEEKIMETQSWWFISFSAGQWCEPCMTLMPSYKRVAKDLHGTVRAGWVHCDKWPQFCVSQGVTAYPLVRMYSSGKGPAREGPGRREHSDYSGEWLANGIVAWASEQFPNKVTKLTSETYRKRVQNGKNTWLVTYSAPAWCAPCRAYQSTLRRIAYLLRHDNLKVGWLDCDTDKPLCNSAGITAYPTTLLHSRGGTVVESEALSHSANATVSKASNQDTVDTVAWVRENLPPMRGDTEVVSVLKAFYNKFDPGTKSLTELHAISCKYSGKEEKLYQTLSEKYGEHPAKIAQASTPSSSTLDYLPSNLMGMDDYAFLASIPGLAGLSTEKASIIVGVILIVLTLTHMLSEGALRWLFPASREKTVLLIGSGGNVGSGIAAAFRGADWKVVGVDQAFRGSMAFEAGDDSFASTAEALPDAWLRRTLRKVSFIIYTAENGNRDDYVKTPTLGKSNNDRFRKFCDRCKNLLRSYARPHIIYVGGSWTKRSAGASDGGDECADYEFVVNDDSPNKVDSEVLYEQAKISSEENAKQVGAETGFPITFADWISIVPNFAPNFSIAKMTNEAVFRRTVTYSPGGYGRPMLHRQDAGELLVAYCERARSKRGFSTPKFSKFLIPGIFIPFKTFADVVMSTVLELELHEQFGVPVAGDADEPLSPTASGGSSGADQGQDRDMPSKPPVTLIEKEDTPAWLKTRCESKAAEELGFKPKESMVLQGLRDSCTTAWRKTRLASRTNSPA